MEKSTSYIQFLKFCLNDNLPVPTCIKDINWHDLLIFGMKQAISGLYAPTILMKDGKLTSKEDFMGNKPTDDDVMEWVFEDYRLRKINKTMFERTEKASEWFLENGFRNYILKGQGNAILYPDPMLRSSGDIDIWLEGGQEKILSFTKKYYDKEYNRLHVDFPMFRDASVEVHFRPSSMINPWMNKKMWKYFDEVADEQFSHKVTSPDGKYTFYMPTNYFNLFYQLDHIFRHLVIGGVGLRQIIDYYYLLRKRVADGADAAADKELIATLKRFKMLKFAKAVMYVLHEELGLDKKYLYTEPNEKEGKFLLDEMLKAGNFGHYEERLKEIEKKESKLYRFLLVQKFNLRLLSHYPSEAMWMPYLSLKAALSRSESIHDH